MKRFIQQYFKEIKEDFNLLIKPYFINKFKSFSKLNSQSEISFLDYLPYRTYDAKNGVFENVNSLGFILKVSHFVGIDIRAKQVLKSIINEDVHADYTVQIINYASPKIGNLLDYWASFQSSMHLFKKIVILRTNFFKNGCWKNIFQKRKDILIRNYELYICISSNKPYPKSWQESEKYQLTILKDKIIEALKGINCFAIQLKDNDFCEVIKEIVNPTDNLYKNNIIKHYDDIRQSLVSNHNIELKRDKAVLSNENKNFNYLIFEVISWPQSWRIENSVEYVGQFEEGLSIPCPFYITMGFRFNNAEGSKRTAEKYRVVNIKQNDSSISRFFPRMYEEMNDWQYTSDQINLGDRLGYSHMMIVLCINDASYEERFAQITKNHFTKLGFKIERVKYDTINPFIYSLPFGIGENWNILNQLKIPSKMLSSSCINLMPVFADNQNYGSPLLMLVGRMGQLFFFDNFKTADEQNGNFNMCLVGGSGRGKSVLLQEYTLATLRFGGDIIILDNGRSFQNFCNLLKGDFIDFGSKDFCINPFSLYDIGEKVNSTDEYREFFEEPFIDLILSILCILININKDNNTDPEVGLYKSILSQAIIEVMNTKGRSGGFADIHQVLLTNDSLRNEQTRHIIDKIEFVLRAYSTGRYAKYFNGEATLNIKNRLTVFEFSDLQYNETLQSSVLLTVVFLTYTKMRKREKRVALLIDEAHKQLKHPVMKGPISTLVRTTRKYDACLFIATQRLADFDNNFSEASAAAFSQSDWKILMSAEGEDNQRLKEKLSMNDAEIKLVQNLTGLKGAYSEFMIRHSNKCWQIGRLILDKFSAKLYSTKADDVVALNKLINNGLSVEEAIESLIKEEV